MAITQNDLDISNKSYINKDFDSVYNELLTLAKKISYRYDPTASNESDPFIVLLKLLAFVTDKINYNIDKNILERFMPSATQESSMRDLTSRMGYNMHYYIAAETQVTFRYRYPENYNGADIFIPKYSVVTSDTNDVDFITLKDVPILKNTGTSSDLVDVMQGVLNSLTVIGSDNKIIQLENLDENNRLYFPESNVAQNGVFISGDASYDSRFAEGWTLVDNLNLEEYGRPCYVFGYDSTRKLPYIEFPEWILSIIGGGIQVDYLVCSGSRGNVVVGALSSVSFSTDNILIEGFASSDVRVNNSEAALNGSDPETIDEAYQGFKKTIGTFNTLVTCRDYANAIYNALGNSGNNIVSNVQVGDRRSDINYGCNVVEYTDRGIQTRSEITNLVEDITDPDDPGVIIRTITPDIMAFDLCVYAFNPVRDLSFYSASNSSGYTRSFERLQDMAVVEAAIEDNKCVSHNIKRFNDGDILAIKNYYTLEAVISAAVKVNLTEQLKILENVREALASNFNARKLEFGYEIPYDLLLSTIEGADARIRSVSLNEPSQEPKALLYRDVGDKEYSVRGVGDTGIVSNNWFKDVVVKNAFAGRVSLFDYDTDFEYNYGQSTAGEGTGKFLNVLKITTRANIDSIDSTPVELKSNEVIQFIAPSYITKITYPYGIRYKYIGSNVSADTEYALSSGESFAVRYVNNNNETIDKEYGVGEIIKPNFELSAGSGEYEILGTSEEVAIREINNEMVENRSIRCYWQSNKADNSLVWIEDASFDDSAVGPYHYCHIMEENEYFFYTDINYSSLYSCGAGTKLRYESAIPLGGSFSWTSGVKIPIGELPNLMLGGISGFAPYFVIKSFESSTLIVEEQQIVTLTTGDSVKVGGGHTFAPENNTFTSLDTSVSGNIYYAFGGGGTYRTLTPLGDRKWCARALLDINAGPYLPQTLDGGQEVTLYFEDSTGDGILESETLSAGSTFRFSLLEQLSGGEDIDLSYSSDASTTAYPSIYVYEESALTDKLSLADEHLYSVLWPGVADGVGKYTTSLTIPGIGSGDISEDVYIMCYRRGGTDEEDLLIKAFEADGVTEVESLNKFNITGTPVFAASLSLGEGMSIIKIRGNGKMDYPTVINFVTTDATINLTVSSPRHVLIESNADLDRSKINPLLGLQPADDILGYMANNYAQQFELFYISNYIDDSKAIELSDAYPLSSAQAFYDYNNVANKWTIPELSFEESNLRIARGSIK